MAFSKSILLCLGVILVANSFCHGLRLTRLKSLDKLRGNSTLSHDQAKQRQQYHGRLLIGQDFLQGAKLGGTKAAENALDVNRDYQADMRWGQPKQFDGQTAGSARVKSDHAAVEQLLKMEPKVECTGESMKLQVQDAASTPGSLLFVDRGSLLSPLPLSNLPLSCGYNIKSTRRDLILVAPYDGCFVALEEDSYVLPLRWSGLPVRMSCPLLRQSSPNPPMVTCHAEGMVVKLEWTISTAKIKVELNGEWEPLMKASPKCGFGVVEHPEGVIISVRYATCLEKRDGRYTLKLTGEGVTSISCPSLSPAQPEPPAKPAAPPQPQFSQGQVYQPPSPPPVPENQMATIPTAAPKPPQPEPLPGQVYPPFYPFNPNLFYPQPGPGNQPATKPTAIPKPPQPQQPKVPQGQVHQPLNPQPVPEYHPATKPTAAPKPPQPEVLPGQVYPPFYPFNPNFLYPQPGPGNQPEIMPTAIPKPPQPQKPEVPQGQVHQPLNPEPMPEYQPATKPTAAPKPPPQPGAPWGQVYQPIYPHLLPETLPATKPTAIPKPPQPQKPEVPQGQVHQPLNPQPVPEYQPAMKPTAAPKPPPQPEAPWGQVYQPIYPHPVPETQPATQPTAIPKPPQPELLPGQVYPPFYPFNPNFLYPQPGPGNQPEIMPTAIPKPPQPQKPKVPQGQVHQPLNPEPMPEYQPATKPTAAPKPPPQPEAPWGQVYQPIYPHPVPETQPATKPTAIPKLPQPELLPGQVYPPFYPFNPNFLYPQPGPGNQPEIMPTAIPKPPQPQKPEVPQGQVHQPLNPEPMPEYQPATKPTAAPKPPPQPEAPWGQVYQPIYPHPVPETQPATKPTAIPKPPQPELLPGQVYPPFYTFNPNFFYPQPGPENQLELMPTAVPKPQQPQQPKVPQGQVHQPLNPQAVPENQPATKPTAAPKPPQPGQVHPPFFLNPVNPNLFYPHPGRENQPEIMPTAVRKPPQPPQPEAPQGQIYQPPYPEPVPENHPVIKPTAAPKPPPQPELFPSQVYPPFYPNPFNPNLFYPKPKHEIQPATKPTAAPQPVQPEAPQGQVYWPPYPQPVPENRPATKPTTAPKPPPPSQPEAPWSQYQPLNPQPVTENQGQVYPPFYAHPFNPNFFYPKPKPENQLATKPTAAPEPPQPEVPQGQVYQPSYPQPVPENQPATMPTVAPKPPQHPSAVNHPNGHVPQPFNPYFHPQLPQPITLPPATSMQPPQQVTTLPSGKFHPDSTPKPNISAIVPHGSHVPSIYCPQYCPSGSSNCCPQIAFHQHLHHVVPIGPSSKDAFPVYPGLSLFSSLAYSGLGAAPLPQKPTEAATSPTSAPIPIHSPSAHEKQSYFQPPDGNPAALPGGNHGLLTNYEQLNPYSIPNSNIPSKPKVVGNEPVPNNVSPSKQKNYQLSAGNFNYPYWSFMSSFSPNLQQHSTRTQNTPTFMQQHSNQKANEFKQPTEEQSQKIPYYMLQDAQVPSYNRLAAPNHSTKWQPFVRGLNRPITHKQTVNISSEPKGYILLQHGPPGREPNSLSAPPLPFRDVVHDVNLVAQSLPWHRSRKPEPPQNLSPPQEKTQQPKWQPKVISNPKVGDVEDKPGLGDESKTLLSLFSATDDDPVVPLPQDPSVTVTHSKSKLSDILKDFWKPMVPLTSSHRIPAHVPGKETKQWSSATDHRANGLNQPLQRKDGDQKLK